MISQTVLTKCDKASNLCPSYDQKKKKMFYSVELHFITIKTNNPKSININTTTLVYNTQESSLSKLLHRVVKNGKP